MTGIDDPYETPKHHDLRLQTGVISVDESVGALLKAIDSTKSEAVPSGPTAADH